MDSYDSNLYNSTIFFIGECYVCSRDNGDGGYRISFIYTNICKNYVAEGYKYLESFEKDYIPIFTYQVEGITIKKLICMDYGKNTVCLLYRIQNQDAETTLKLAPLVNFRDFHSMSTNHHFNIRQEVKDKKVKIKGDPNLFTYGVESTVGDITKLLQALETSAKEIADNARGIEFDEGEKKEKSTGNVNYIDHDKWLKTFNDKLIEVYGADNVKANDTPSEVINTVIQKRKDSMKEGQTFESNAAIAEFKKLQGEQGRKEIRKVYEKSKSNINQYLKTLKKMESAARRFKILPTDASSEIHKAVAAVNKLGSYTAKVNRGGLKMLNMIKSQCKQIIVVAAAQQVGDLKTESYSSYIESVEIL